MNVLIWLCSLLSLSAIGLSFLADDFSLRISYLLLGSQLGIDDVNRPFLMVTGIAWLIAGFFTGDFAARQGNRRFVIAYTLTLLGNLAVVLSQDFVTFYTAFAVMSLSAYGIIITTSSHQQHFAGRVYITLTILGELLLFAAMVGLVHNSGDIYYGSVATTPPPAWLTLFVLLGFGIKAGLLPLHVTLPLVYQAAPPASAIALAGAALNAGILGWLRWLPFAEAGMWSGILLIGVGMAGYLYAILIGLSQVHPRALLGYSSISQVALMVIVIGVGLISPEDWSLLLSGLLFMIIHHAVAKTCLFVASTGIPETNPSRHLWWLGVTVAGLGLAGAPFTGGYAAKSLLTDAVALVPAIRVLESMMWISSVMTALLIGRFLWLMKQSASSVPTLHSQIGSAISLVAIGAMTIFAVTSGSWSLEAVLLSVIPLIVALIIVVLFINNSKLLSKLSSILSIRVPAGDIALPVSRACAKAGRQLLEQSSQLSNLTTRFTVVYPKWANIEEVDRLANAPDPKWHDSSFTLLACTVLLIVSLALFIN